MSRAANRRYDRWLSALLAVSATGGNVAHAECAAQAAPRTPLAPSCSTPNEPTGHVRPRYLGWDNPCSKAGAKLSVRHPSCYLEASWLPSEYSLQGNTVGAFWAANGCYPAMAFPVASAIQDGPQGFVVVGTRSSAAAQRVRDLLKTAPLSWHAAFGPDAGAIEADSDGAFDEHAACLISVDFRSDAGPVPILAPALANFYAHWCPALGCDALEGAVDSPDGLGLAISSGIEVDWRVRPPTFAGDVPARSAAMLQIQRFAFTRGVLFGDDLAGPCFPVCAPDALRTVDLASAPFFDPTGGPAPWPAAVSCSSLKQNSFDGAPASEPPPQFRLLPTSMDAELRASASRLAASSKGSSCLLEGIPNGLLVDNSARTGGVAGTVNQLRNSYLFSTRASVAQVPASESWLTVPEAIGFWDQHYVFVRRSNARGVTEVAPLTPTGPVELGRTGALDRRLIRQTFSLTGHAQRTVETVEAAPAAGVPWPRASDSFDTGTENGARWASNAGTADCWATTGFDQALDPWLRFAFPMSAGALGEEANDFCPSELAAWLARTQTTRSDPEHNLCAKEQAAKKDAKDAVIAAVGACAKDPHCPVTSGDGGARGDGGIAGDGGRVEPKADASDSDEACCRSAGCDPTQPSTCPQFNCCMRLARRLIESDTCYQQCIADHAISETGTSLPPSQHWVDVNDATGMKMIPMVGLIRTSERWDPPVPGTIGSFRETEASTDDEEASDGGTPGAADGGLLATVGADAGAVPLERIEVAGLRSQMTNNDLVVAGAHQTLDWNWVAEPGKDDGVDPAYRGIAVRDGHFLGIENELEMGVPAGLWLTHTTLEGGHSYTTHGIQFLDFLTSEGNVEHLGEIWPTDFCDQFGIDRGQCGDLNGDHATCGAADDCEATENSSIPAYSCGACPGVPLAQADARIVGTQYPHRYWRTHMGRGLFSPISPLTAAPSQDDAARMATMSSWVPGTPEPTETVGLGLEDWGSCPHRIAFLGRPIIDCGHGDGECDPGSRLEIHPPHLVTMDLATRAFPGASCAHPAAPCEIPPPNEACTTGTVSAVFGWSNVFAGRRWEFDLWPPPRPTANSNLCVVGVNHNETPSAGPSGGSSPSEVVQDLGYRIDASPRASLPCGRRVADPPRLSCIPVPLSLPNHLHCVYEDPAAEAAATANPPCTQDSLLEADDGTGTGTGKGKWLYGNPRATPRFVTSRFEARFFLGWYEGSHPELCPSCADGGPCTGDL